jgi:hypothetical protein
MSQLRLFQDRYLRSEKKKREHIPVLVVESGATPKKLPRNKIKKNRRIVSSLPVFKTESFESGAPTMPSEETEHSHTTQPHYMEWVIDRGDTHDPTFGV